MSASGTITLSQLAAILGEANVLIDPTQLASYSVDGKMPSAAVRPGSEEEVAELLKFAARENLATIVSGARTKLGIGMPPHRYDLALDITRLNRLVAYDPGDLTLSVQAGTPLGTIASALATHSQFLPLTVPFASRATIGGTIASGVDSPLRQSYGTGRDFVLGVHFITGDGVAAKSGGRVVKNVSGYDIHKLMIGSLGTLGAITRINFRTFPSPRRTCAFVVGFLDLTQACAFRNAIARSVLRPRTLEIVSESGPRNVLPGMSASAGGRWSIYVSFAGEDEALKRHRAELASLLESNAGEIAEPLVELSSDGADDALKTLSQFPAVVLERCPAAAIFKISALPTELPGLAAGIASIDMPWAAVIRGIGVAYLALLPPDSSDASLALLRKNCTRILGLAGRAPWRHVTVPWCPLVLKREVNVWGIAPGSLDLMKQLKRAFDPGGILSPGRFVGGI